MTGFFDLIGGGGEKPMPGLGAAEETYDHAAKLAEAGHKAMVAASEHITDPRMRSLALMLAAQKLREHVNEAVRKQPKNSPVREVWENLDRLFGMDEKELGDRARKLFDRDQGG